MLHQTAGVENASKRVKSLMPKNPAYWFWLVCIDVEWKESGSPFNTA